MQELLLNKSQLLSITTLTVILLPQMWQHLLSTAAGMLYWSWIKHNQLVINIIWLCLIIILLTFDISSHWETIMHKKHRKLFIKSCPVLQNSDLFRNYRFWEINPINSYDTENYIYIEIQWCRNYINVRIFLY